MPKINYVEIREMQKAKNFTRTVRSTTIGGGDTLAGKSGTASRMEEGSSRPVSNGFPPFTRRVRA